MPHHMLLGARLPWPTPWDKIFGRTAPLLLEIGFGGGTFLLNLAQRRPEANVLGAEISLPSLRRVERKLQKANLANVRIVHANARLLLWALCAPGSVSGITVNFPDPWPKPGHHQRRLINEEFLRLVATRMVDGANLDIATDHAGYAQAITAVLATTPYFHSRLDAPLTNEDETRSRTKYEMIALAEGRTCYYFKWQRNNVPAPDKFPMPKEVLMPHVILRSSLGPVEIGRRFEPIRATAAGVNVRFLEIYQSPQDEKLLVETYIQEEPLTQHVGLIIRQRDAGDLIVSLHEIGFPRPTAGVRWAIRYLAEWIAGLDPGIEIIHSNFEVKRAR